MYRLLPIVGTGLLFAASNIALAGTIIEMKSDDGHSKILTDGRQVRLGTPGGDYVIIDSIRKVVNAVSPSQQTVMLLDTKKMAAGNKGVDVRTAINDLGAGVQIAGYATRKFAFSANGKPCGVIFGSKEVYRKEGIKELFQAMETMMKNQQAILGGLAGMIDDCALADMQVSKYVNDIGLPMRTERNGRVEMEITSIQYGVSLPAGTFIIPPSYKVISMQEQMKALPKDMAPMKQPGKHNQSMQMPPQFHEAMQQMQQSGQMTPEMIEQIRRAQEMMKQQYQ